MISLIAAVAPNNIIGKNGTLPWNIPEDIALFKEITTGHKVVMGKNTFKSIKKTLKNRQNIIISSKLISKESIKVFSDFHSFYDVYHTYSEEIFIIGGQQLYSTALPFAKKLYISHIKTNYTGDTFFPEINYKNWDIEFEKNYKDFLFRIYKKK